MELRDGFIVGIFNYCDRWCETCAFTPRCRLFADLARYEAMLDPGFKTIVNGPSLTQGGLPPQPKWIEEMSERWNADLGSRTGEDVRSSRSIALEHRPIQEHAIAYAERVHNWLRKHVWPDVAAVQRNPHDAVSVIAWFASMNCAKIQRALLGLAEFDGDREVPPDHEGAAKVAVIGIERSYKAWMQLVADARVTADVAMSFIEELLWLLEMLDDVFPRARAFVRPGFDEPEALIDSAWSRGNQ
jgi:hypothetical protein